MKLKKSMVFIISVTVLLLICFVLFGAVDIIRFRIGKAPVFIIKEEHLNDGGTTVYYGVGYQLIDWKKIDSNVISDIQYRVGREYHIFSCYDVTEGPTVELKKNMTAGKM